MPIKITGPASRPSFTTAEHQGHLCLFVHPTSGVRTTRHGEGEAARCAYAVCVDEYLPFIDVLVWGNSLVPRLVDADDGAVVVGRLVKGEPKPGMNPPWLLEDPDDEDMATAQSFVDQYASQAKSGAISIDVKAIERDRSVSAAADEKF
jgi:hypothetical protein